jgi:hypothetical protein
MKKLTFLVFLFLSLKGFSQNFDFKSNYNPSDKKLLQDYFKFEKIDYCQSSISGKELKNKNYIINLKEFKEGILISTICLAKSNNEYYAVIDSTNFNFNILGKRVKNNFELNLFFHRYWTKKFILKLQSKHAKDYILKETIYEEKDMRFNEPFVFLLLTTPAYHSDGSASWCEVAANDTPEKIYENNKIPHFYVFEMTILSD